MYIDKEQCSPLWQDMNHEMAHLDQQEAGPSCRMYQ